MDWKEFMNFVSVCEILLMAFMFFFLILGTLKKSSKHFLTACKCFAGLTLLIMFTSGIGKLYEFTHTDPNWIFSDLR